MNPCMVEEVSLLLILIIQIVQIYLIWMFKQLGVIRIIIQYANSQETPRSDLHVTSASVSTTEIPEVLEQTEQKSRP